MNKLYTYFPITSTAVTIPPPAGSVTSLNTLTGDIILAAGTGISITPTGNTLTVAATGTSGVTTIGTIDTGTLSFNGLFISSTTLFAQSASVTYPGLVNNTTQSFSGNKTFTGTIGASNFSGNSSGTNTGDVTIGTANGLSLAAQVLSLALSSTSTTGALSSTDWNTFNNKQASGNYITALTGDATASGPGSVALTLATVNGNVGSFGSATNSSTFTVNAKGLITAASSTAIQITESQVTNLVSDLAGKQATGNYITALTGDVTAAGPGSVAATIANLAVTNAKIANATIDLTTKVTGALPIANGGTGQVTKAAAFDALSPMTTGGDLIYGGTSGTGTRLPNGAAGQFLVSGGTTVAPVWTSSELPTVVGPSTLRTFYAMNEDWNTGALAGSYGWTATTATGTVVMNTANLDSTHWGIVALTSGTVSANAALLSLNTALRSVVLGAAVNIYMEMLINLSRLSASGTDDYVFRVGLMDNWVGLPNNGVWFDYSTLNNSSVNWFRSTANGGTRTQTNSTVAPTTGWLKLAVVITGVTSAQFYVNDVSIGTNTTNLPTGAMWPSIGISKTTNGATNTTALIDYYSFYANWPGGR